jgi:hypothetical protein
MADDPYLQWPVFRRSIVAAFQRSLTGVSLANSDRRHVSRLLMTSATSHDQRDDTQTQATLDDDDARKCGCRGIASDPEFRSALVSYIEWGSRLAVINSQPGEAVESSAPMPRWGWGEVGGPYQP